MADDEVGRPLWQLPTDKPFRTAEEIAREAGVTEAQVREAIHSLVRSGALMPLLAPVCTSCGQKIGEYEDPEYIPEELACPYCGQTPHFSDLDLRIIYRDTSPGS